MLVMTVERLSRHDFNNDVCRGSSSQDLLRAFSMIFRISSIEAAVKAVKGWPSKGVSAMKGSTSPRSLFALDKLVLMVPIIPRK